MLSIWGWTEEALCGGVSTSQYVEPAEFLVVQWRNDDCMQLYLWSFWRKSYVRAAEPWISALLLWRVKRFGLVLSLEPARLFGCLPESGGFRPSVSR